MLQLKRQVLLYGAVCAAILVIAMTAMLVASLVSRPAPELTDEEVPSLVILSGSTDEPFLLIEEDDSLLNA